MQKKILNFSLFFLSLVATFFAWFSVSQAITVAGSSVWLVPVLWFSFLYIIFSLEFILVKENFLINLSLVLGLFSSLIFASNLWHFLVLLWQYVDSLNLIDVVFYQDTSVVQAWHSYRQL